MNIDEISMFSGQLSIVLVSIVSKVLSVGSGYKRDRDISVGATEASECLGAFMYFCLDIGCK